jgi:hypothetical protein
MLIRMRTTLNIPDELYRRIRVRAAEERVTVTSLVEQALQNLLESGTREPPAEPFRIRPVGATGEPRVDLHDNVAVLDMLDEGAPANARR